MNNYYYQNYTSSTSLDTRVSQIMKLVYVKMFLALLVTTVVAWFVSSQAQSLAYALVQNRGLYWGLAIVEIILVFAISGSVSKMKSTTATVLFYAFAIVNGLVFSLIFMAYSFDSIFKTFLITAGTFGAMSVYGYFTQKDLTKIGSFLYMALWGLIICLVINIFWPSGTLGWIISFAGVIIFIGLTAWDTQKIKMMAQQAPNEAVPALATIGALSLYLDFINLFIYLLRFFGQARD